MKKHISVYLPKRIRQQDVFKRVRRIAERRNRSTNYIINEALKEYVEDKDMETA